jgi:hypothetical protein
MRPHANPIHTRAISLLQSSNHSLPLTWGVAPGFYISRLRRFDPADTTPLGSVTTIASATQNVTSHYSLATDHRDLLTAMLAIILVTLCSVFTAMSFVLVGYQLARTLFHPVNVGAPVRAVVSGA